MTSQDTKHRDRVQLTAMLHGSHVIGFDCANAVKTKWVPRENPVSTQKGRTSQTLNKQSIDTHKHTLQISREDVCKVSVIGEGTVGHYILHGGTGGPGYPWLIGTGTVPFEANPLTGGTSTHNKNCKQKDCYIQGYHRCIHN
jgi:hypothetical protein